MNNTTHVMKTLMTFTSVLLPVLLANNASAQSERANETLTGKLSQRAQLIARIEPATIKLGLPVVVRLTLKNNYRDTLRVMDSSDEQDYNVLVVDSTGKEARRTNFGRRLLDEEKHFRSILVLVRPGDQVEASVDVTKIYTLTGPRPYYLRVTRTLLPESDDKMDSKVVEKAVSNPVEFTLVE